MRKKEFIFLLCLAGALLSACARGASPKDQKDAADLPETLDGSVDMLFSTMNLKDIYERLIPAALDEQIELNPQIASLRDVMEEFLEKYMGWEVVGPELKKLYMASFTKEEIDEMIIFYRTPTGKKAAALTPELQEKGAAIGKRMVNEHLPELTAMIQKKLNASAPAPETPPATSE